MPALRKSLAVLLLLGCAALPLTTIGPPEKQPAVRVAVFAIHGYQKVLRPVVRHFVKCRYVPTCSEYSIGAFRGNGFWRGAVLTVHRVRSCTSHVPMGTIDLPPSRLVAAPATALAHAAATR